MEAAPHQKKRKHETKAVEAVAKEIVAKSKHKHSSKNSSHGKFQSKGKTKTEKKNFDTGAAIAAFQPNGTAVLVPINMVNTGATAITAVGRVITMKSIHVRLNTLTPAAAAPYACRLLCVYDRSPNGALPIPTAVVANNTDGAAVLMNLGNSDRFSILFDEKFITGGSPGADNACMWVDRYVKCSLTSKALGNAFTGAIAGVEEGSVYLLALSSGTVTPGPTITEMATRVRFYDT